MTVGLYLLRCNEAGVRLSDLDALDIGLVYDLFTEKGNDGCEYVEIATQEDMDRL